MAKTISFFISREFKTFFRTHESHPLANSKLSCFKWITQACRKRKGESGTESHPHILTAVKYIDGTIKYKILASLVVFIQHILFPLLILQASSPFKMITFVEQLFCRKVLTCLYCLLRLQASDL